MNKKPSPSNPHSGEAGYRGHDRQPQKQETDQGTQQTPDPDQAATPQEVQDRSADAITGNPNPVNERDQNHPGPDRLESEKSKGHLHHNQHEKEPDMQNKLKDL